jgi:16S rRNA (guanine527-N7)-methyltransferase
METILKYFSDFSALQLHQFTSLDVLYKEWNRKINVISRKDIEGLYEKHVLHSLSIAAAFNFKDGSELIDIGTGGGFPGIPLAIFFPGAKFHLVDSIAKKIKVVDAIAKEVGLENITTEHIRAEDIKGRKYDFAVSRAVAPLKQLWNWSKPLLKKPPRTQAQDSEADVPLPGLICLKGGDLTTEIAESRTRPRIMEITELFPEDAFKEKYILYVNS